MSISAGLSCDEGNHVKSVGNGRVWLSGQPRGEGVGGRARRELGWQPQPVEQEVSEAVDYYQAHP